MLFYDGKINVKEYNPLALAYVGDTVYDLFVRTKILEKGNRHVTNMHKEAVNFVKAHSQAVSAHALENYLTEEEALILKWGRNAKSNTVPKHADVLDYRIATGFETLLGYLYLDNKAQRLNEIMQIAYNEAAKQFGE